MRTGHSCIYLHIKFSVLVVILFLMACSLFSYDLLEVDGHVWKNLTIGEALKLVQGMMMGQYILAKMLVAVRVIDHEDEMIWLEKLTVHDVMDVQIMYEISAFYYNTGRFEYPVSVVFFIRNEWKIRDIPKFDVHTWLRRR